MKFLFDVLLATIFFGGIVNSQKSFLDLKFSPILKTSRRVLNSLIKPHNFAHGIEFNKKSNKVQQQFSEDSNFFCDIHGPGARSSEVPKSVHQLRPGDIDIVGAIGDSLTAGNGAFALDALQVLLEGRGVSWAIGGQKTWRNFLTIPNIIKEFNPNLYGYSSTDSVNADDKSSLFNVASAGAMTGDTVHQAKNLVKRMKIDPHVDMKNHWKLISYMIGGNDFCLDICYHQNQDKVIENAEKALIQVLRILRENLPRTMVNIILPPDVTILTRFTKKPAECESFHYFECPCFFSLNHLKNRERSSATIRRWQKRMAEIVKLPEFHNRNDFEVNIHTFLTKTDIPKEKGITEYKYMSKDCFHLSQLGHARAANSYWNSMLTPKTHRHLQWKNEFEEFKCPTEKSPFLKTNRN